MLGVVCKFLLSLVGALVGFYVFAQMFDYLGVISPTARWHIREFYTILLRPITSQEWPELKTEGLLVVVLAVNTLLLASLYRRWSYRPATVNDPLALVGRQQIAAPRSVQANANAAVAFVEQAYATSPAAPQLYATVPLAATGNAGEYDRLIALLGK